MNKIPVPDGPAGDMDDLLRRFLHAEMPRPWPASPVPAGPRCQRPTGFWSRGFARTALAAAIALLLTGYVGLARWFPHDTTGGGLPASGPEIGDFRHLRPRAPGAGVPVGPGNVERITTPHGRDAILLEEITDEDRPTVMFHIEALPTPNDRR